MASSTNCTNSPDVRPQTLQIMMAQNDRIWLVGPTNQFGGYEVTLQGHLDGASMQASALCETYEESGRHVCLIQHAMNVRRTQT